MSRSTNSSLWQYSRILIAMTLLMLTYAVQTSIAQQDDTARAQQDDEKLLNGLRDRQLFDLANDYCEKLLTADDLPSQRQAALVVQQLKTMTAQAVFSPTEGRAKIWQRVDRIAVDFSSSFRGTRGFLVRAQKSLATIAQAELIRQEIDARLAQPDANETAISLLRSVRDELDDTIRDIDKAIRRASDTETPTDLSSSQLLALKSNLQFQYAVCNIERSQLYSADDKANRKDALSQAMKQIANASRSIERGRPLWWEAKLTTTKCLRLLGRNEEADAELKTLPANLLPTNLKPQYRTEQLKVAVANANQKLVATLVSQALENAQRTPPEDIALVEATAWVAKTAPPAQAVKWKALAASLLQTTKSSHGRYWGRRAELILVDSIEENTNNPSSLSVSPDADLLILAKAAQTAVEDKRYTDAVNDFAKAILLGKRQSDYESVLRLSIQQGRVFEALGQPADAAKAMIDAAIVKPKLAHAAAAHLRGCWNLSQTISGPDVKQQANLYQKRLEDHLQTWPSGPTSETALMLLGKHHSRSRKYQAAMDSFLRVPVESTQSQQALVQAASAAWKLLQSLEQSQQPVNLMTERLLGRLSQPARKNPALNQLTELLAADINVRYRSRLPDRDTAVEFQQAPLIDANGLAELRLAVEIISEIKDLNTFANSLNKSQNKRRVQQLLHGYLNAMRIREDSSNSLETLAKADLMVAQQAAADAQRANERELATVWKLQIAELQQNLNQNEAAIKTLTDLVNEFPRKADLQIRLAEAMTKAYGRSDPDKPINQWRRLAAKLRPRSDNWFLAKYNVAKLLRSSGKREDALKLLKYIKANPPGWDESKLKSDFDSLFEKLN